MEWLPSDYEEFWTLAGTVHREGIGLHSGKQVSVELSPSNKEGFHVSWMNSECLPITVNSRQVINSQLCTSLKLGDKNLSTVEHLFAALSGCGLTHANIKVSGDEIPLLDGSAICWVEAIREAGIYPVKTLIKRNLVLREPLIINQGNSVITATPSDSCKLIGIIDFPYPAIGQQTFSIDLCPQKFVEDIAPARTFGFKDQVEHLRSQGLIKGGNLANSLVCDGNKWLNPPLRFPDEPVRHKLLDLIGDLALVGLPKAQVLVYKGSHSLHAELASAIQQVFSLSKSSLD